MEYGDNGHSPIVANDPVYKKRLAMEENLLIMSAWHREKNRVGRTINIWIYKKRSKEGIGEEEEKNVFTKIMEVTQLEVDVIRV